MKRFYKTAGVFASGNGFDVQLDGRAIRTPARNLMSVPSRALAELLAAEWDAQGDDVDRMSMPLNRMCGTAIDGLAGKRAETVSAIAAYGATDMVCYWADKPQRLIQQQQASWRPLLDWMTQRFDIDLDVVSGILPISQTPENLQRLHGVIDSYDNFRLVGLSVATGTAGSVVIGLALVEQQIDARTAFEAAQLDESFQIAEWGEDAEATKRREAVRAEFGNVANLIGAL